MLVLCLYIANKLNKYACHIFRLNCDNSILNLKKLVFRKENVASTFYPLWCHLQTELSIDQFIIRDSWNKCVEHRHSWYLPLLVHQTHCIRGPLCSTIGINGYKHNCRKCDKSSEKWNSWHWIKLLRYIFYSNFPTGGSRRTFPIIQYSQWPIHLVRAIIKIIIEWVFAEIMWLEEEDCHVAMATSLIKWILKLLQELPS